MKALFTRDFFRFFFGFLGIISLALFILVAIGFYQVELSGSSTVVSSPAPTFGGSGGQ